MKIQKERAVWFLQMASVYYGVEEEREEGNYASRAGGL